MYAIIATGGKQYKVAEGDSHQELRDLAQRQVQLLLLIRFWL